MDELFTGGKLGELFAALAFSGALVATISYFLAEKNTSDEKTYWENIGSTGFILHAVGVFGIIGTLFGLIYFHKYEYHYVWAHSSNELPVYYMISCFWEGQEGSFLLWSFWHSILGLVLLKKAGKWRNIVLAVVASVELILSSMVLGIFISAGIAKILFSIIMLALGAYLLYKFFKPDKSEKGILHLLGAAVSLFVITLVWSGQSGFYQRWKRTGILEGIDALSFSLVMVLLAVLALAILSALLNFRKKAGEDSIEPSVLEKFLYGQTRFFSGEKKSQSHGYELVAAAGITALGLIIALVEIGSWKIGSTPFIMLKDAMPDQEIFLINPDFVPANGTGLNPLLQNYWMVIHPPTLFLGFASTVIPFAYVIGALIRRDYTGWIRPASPWTIFAVLWLGAGIIMGGYWAYETLNFGGYWNWDPVENASLVPWLIGIAALHGMLAYRKSKSFLKLSMLLIVFTFLLVLYSTFLTRSGILGDASVHTFTDLGLSGQLLVLLFVYFIGVFFLFGVHWKYIPEERKEISFWSKEFFLFLATIIFIFSGIGITISTSLPVINKIFSTNLAAPAEVQFFYFRWNIWFAIMIAVFSGIGQFLFWTKVEKDTFTKAIFKPFLLAILMASGVIIAMAFGDFEFAFEKEYIGWLELAQLSDSLIISFSKFVQFGIFIFTDEILLAASLFTIFSNSIIFYQLIKKNRKSLKVTGGSLSHIGFGFMLIGILFSSGFDEIVSKNINPAELQGFREKDQVDNVLLPKRISKKIAGYEVTYLGKKKAIAPVSNLRIIEENKAKFKLRFEDARDETFAVTLPVRDFSYKQEGELKVDLEYLKTYLDELVAYIDPDMINERSLFGIEFTPLKSDVPTASSFVLFPEAEVNSGGNAIISHPARKVFIEKDLYVHVSSIPINDEFKPEIEVYPFEISMGDTLNFGDYEITLNSIESLDSTSKYEVIAQADLEIIKGEEVFSLQPKFRISRDGRPLEGYHFLEEEKLLAIFKYVDPKRGKMGFELQIQTNEEPDWIVFQAIHKPYINFLWLGTFILLAGFGIAIYRRMTEV